MSDIRTRMEEAIQAHSLEALNDCVPQLLKEWNFSSTYNSCCYVACQNDEPEMLRIIRLHSMQGDHDNSILMFCLEKGKWSCARALMECMNWNLVSELREQTKSLKTISNVKMVEGALKMDKGLSPLDFLDTQLADPSLYAARIHHACIVAGDGTIHNIFDNTDIFFDLLDRSHLDVTAEMLFHGLVKGGGICAEGLLERASIEVVQEAINTFMHRADQYQRNSRFYKDPQLMERVQYFVSQCSSRHLTQEVTASPTAPLRRPKM